MAACQLTIKLDDDTPRTAGQTISGTVTVVATKNANCKGLKVSTMWSTSGMGNSDSGIVEQQQVFAGAWQEGNSYSYPFKLNTAAWPPTYYGDYLSVSHYVKARASLAWTTDPQAQKEFVVVATDSPADLKPTASSIKPGLIGGIIIGTLALIFSIAFIPLLLILLAIVAPIFAIGYFIKVILPKQITGPVELTLKNAKVAPGGTLEANLTFTPKRNSTIGGVEWTIACAEECTSGSGSNRKSHRKDLLKEVRRASDQLQLKANERQSFDLSFKLPAHAAPSLKFVDNELKWTVTGRIDIPHWPDWTKTLPLIVTPTATITTAADRDYDFDDDDDFDEDENDNFDDVDDESTDDVDQSKTSSSGDAIPLGSSSQSSSFSSATGSPGAANSPANPAAADQAWFQQVIGQIRNSQHDEDKLSIVLQAVAEFEFPLSVTIEEPLDTPEFATEEEYEQWDDAQWWSSYCPAQNTELALAWELATPKTVEPGSTWSGRASIIGFDPSTRRILMRVTG